MSMLLGCPTVQGRPRLAAVICSIVSLCPGKFARSLGIGQLHVSRRPAAAQKVSRVYPASYRMRHIKSAAAGVKQITLLPSAPVV